MSSPIDLRDRDPYDVGQFEVPDGYREDLSGVLVSAGEIRSRVARLAEEVTESYRDREFYPVCVLKGAMRFHVDLLREVDLQGYGEGVVRASRYHEGPGSDTPAVNFPQPDAIAGKDVLVVEDILDEGHTLAALFEHVESLDARSVEAAVLFEKGKDRGPAVDPAFAGFRIPDEFVVGYGLDYGERYRDFRHLGVVDPDDVGD